MNQNQYLKTLVDNHEDSLKELGTYDMLLEMSDFTELAFVDSAETLVKLTKEQLYTIYQDYKDYDHKVASINGFDYTNSSTTDALIDEYNKLIAEDTANNVLILNTIKNSLLQYLSFTASTSTNESLSNMRMFVAHNTIVYNAFAEQQLRLNVDEKQLSFAKLDNAQLMSNKALLFLASIHDEFMQSSDSFDYTAFKLWKRKSIKINDKLQQFEPIITAILLNYKNKHISELKLSKTYDDINFDTYIKLQSFEVVYECWKSLDGSEGFTKFDFKHKSYKSSNDYIKQLSKHIINCRYYI